MSTWISPQLSVAAAVLQEYQAALQGGAKPSASNTSLPGRLGDYMMDLDHDPRVEPRIKALLSGVGAGAISVQPAAVQLGPSPSLEAIGKVIAEQEAGAIAGFSAIADFLPVTEAEKAVTREDIMIPGGDGQDMLLHIYRSPTIAGKKVPAVVYYHGGGMVMLPTLLAPLQRLGQTLAAAGVLVVMADYRNAYTTAGHFPFPAGLNDCAAAARYVHAHKEKLGVSHLILSGESGGGNLTLATALKANREGWISEIAGVFSMVPYISNAYGWPREEQIKHLPSLVECDGYIFGVAQSAYNAWYYSPLEKDQMNPLAWPYYATDEDLKGLPPHVVQMDELDPLRDEGILYVRKLAAAGVKVDGKLSLGVPHASVSLFRVAVPEKGQAGIRDLIGFAQSL